MNLVSPLLLFPDFWCIKNTCHTAEELTEDEIAVLRHFALKIDTHMTDSAFEKLKYAFPESKVSSFKITRARAEFLAAYRPVPYDCCIKSCCCFAGPHATHQHCPYCKEPRFNSKGKPRRRFTYIPLIPRLIAFYKNTDFSEKLGYRANRQTDPGVIKDVMDAQNYKTLCQTHVSVDGKEKMYKFFEDPRDLALGFSTDGFCPWKKRKKTCWPLLFFNYNLPPEIRFWLCYVLCVGIIPGPNKPKDFDSFLWPVIEELLKLLAGVPAFDAVRQEVFALRAYLLVIFGDIPAISMVMRMKGHNGICPCRMCRIGGLRIPGNHGTTHYVPLNRSQHPTVKNDHKAVKVYQPQSLPLRNHDEFLRSARLVQMASTNAGSERLAKASGIKGIPLLSHLPSLFFPASFPYDFMHLIFENVIKNLVLLWTGDFKGLGEGRGEYELNPGVWDAIGEATVESGSTIPSAFGTRPPNVADDKSALTADTWSFWMLYLAPVLLAGKFRKQVYYDHFIRLVELLHICLQFEITVNDVQVLRQGFSKWVTDFEKYVGFYSLGLGHC